jgi:hypothetical protein
MKIVHLTQRSLSAKAEELVRFDMDSIRQIIASRHGVPPELWLADPEQYERDGRVLRDSTSPRLLAYSGGSKDLYVTDGCNSCSHQMPTELGKLTSNQIQELAAETGIRLELLEKLVESRVR